MNKILKLLKEKIKNILKKYPITMITTLILTLISCIVIDTDLNNEKFIINLEEFLFFFDFGILFSEVSFHKKNRIISIITFFIISICMVALVNSNYITWIFKITISYITIMSSLILLQLFKQSKKNLSTYLIKVFSNLFKTGIIYMILSIGLLLLTLTFNYLILNGNYDSLILRVEILLLGIFLIPSLILDFSNTNEEINNLAKILVHYVLESLVIISFVIMYLYIFKILLTWEMPHNEVFRILSMLFIISCPIWIMNEYYNDKLYKINYYLPFAYIPFIILEIISLGIRIANNGITNMRYIGIIFIIFQIIYLYIYCFKKKDTFIFWTIISLTIISFLLPYVNMISVSNYSQVKIIEKYLKDNNNNNKIKSAYRYLNNNFDGKEYINKYLKNDINIIKTIIEENDSTTDNNRKNISASINLNNINISEYDKLYVIESSAFNNQAIIKYNDQKLDITDNLYDFYKNYSIVNFDEYFSLHNTIYINDLKIIFSRIDLDYQDDILFYYSINGYILEKEKN